MFSGKAEIIVNTKEMMELVCNTDALDKEVADCIVELNIISEQMQSAILENNRVALNQEVRENVRSTYGTLQCHQRKVR